MELKNKIALITGAASGIGRETAKLFATEGAKVAIADLNLDGGKAVVEEISRAGGTALFNQVDVSVEPEVRDWITAVSQKWGGVDILVANAGVLVMGTVEEATEEDWDRVLGVNVKGYAFCAKYAAPYMRQKGGGSIVTVASISAFIATSGFTPHIASKGAVLQLTRCLAHDLAPDNIRANCVCPSIIDTPFVKSVADSKGVNVEDIAKAFLSSQLIKRMGTSLELANAILFLASDRASFITGTSLMVDGGYTSL